MSGHTLRKIDDARHQLLRGGRYDWLETYSRTELAAMEAVAEDADRMVWDCLTKLDRLRES